MGQSRLDNPMKFLQNRNPIQCVSSSCCWEEKSRPSKPSEKEYNILDWNVQTIIMRTCFKIKSETLTDQ